MYCSLPLNFESCAISARDAKTLQHLYSDDVVPDKVAADGISATQEECALDEQAKKEAYAKYPNSPLIKHNLGCAINQVGLSDMNEQKYETAADKFKEALTIDANDKTAKINLGIALMNSGTMRSMQGNMVQAEPYYKQAVELLATGDNQTMLTTAVQHYSKYLTHVGRSSEAQQLEAKYLKH